MSDPEPNSAIAAAVFEKFQFYALGLTFGILALAVQTAAFDGPLVARGAEILGWILLLTSGLHGLSRVESLPHAYKLEGLKQDASSRAHELAKAAESGARSVHVTLERRDYPIEEMIARAKADVGLVDTHLAKGDKTLVRKYKIQKWTFLLGTVSLMIARGTGPVMGILHAL